LSAYINFIINLKNTFFIIRIGGSDKQF
jgi:hypothetical protein